VHAELLTVCGQGIVIYLHVPVVGVYELNDHCKNRMGILSGFTRKIGQMVTLSWFRNA